MSQDDPFAEPSDTERTIVKPMGRQQPAQPQPQAPRAAGGPQAPAASASVGIDAGLSGLNPLCAAAAPLFALVGRIRNRAQHANPEALREAVVREVRAFEQRALQAGIAVQTIRIARYLICATIDDVVLNTPWGEQSVWQNQSMVGTFHKETVGGDRVYDLLRRLEQEPGRHRDLLEFLYVCLSLGFEGRLRVEDRGSEKHFALRDGLARLIRQQRGGVERDLAPRWKGLDLPHRPLAAWAPIWIVTGLTAALLTMLFLGFSWMLQADTERTQGTLAALVPSGAVSFARPAPPPPPPPPPPPEIERETEVFRLREFLRPEIEQNLVEVNEQGNTVTVRIKGEGMFASASDELQPKYVPVVQRIAEGLNQEPGKVLVVGHSDNIPINTARFPNNTVLSLARAKSVMNRIAAVVVDPGRLSAEGRADKDPIASNATPEGRAQNRRIEVILVKSG
jgi:type VI secretion system protein ImpK